MPRKNIIQQVPPRPSLRQMAAHLTANSDCDFIDTRDQSSEYTTLKLLSNHLHYQLTHQYEAGSPLKARYTRLSEACDRLLASCLKAKNVGSEGDEEEFRTAMQDVERDVREFDRQLRDFAYNEDFELGMIFGEDRIRTQALGLWTERGEYAVDKRDQKYLDALSDVQPNLNQNQQPNQVQNRQTSENQQQSQNQEPNQNQNQQQSSSVNEVPGQGGQPNVNADQPPRQEEQPNPNPVVNQQPSVNQNANSGQPVRGVISPAVYRAAAYAAQANDDEYGDDLADLEFFLNGLESEKVRLIGLPDETAHLQDITRLSEAGQQAFTQILDVRKKADEGTNMEFGREALDRAARSLGTFERQYREYREKYPNTNEIQISGMGNYNDHIDQIDLKSGGTVLDKLGYKSPEPLFPANLAPEQIIAAIADELKQDIIPEEGLINQLEQFSRNFRAEVNDFTKHPQVRANARMMAERADELSRAIYNVSTFMKNGEPEQARESMEKAVESLRRFERMYETYQRYDGVNQQRIAGDTIQNIGSLSYEAGENYLKLMGYEQQPAKEGELPTYVPAAPSQQNLRNIPYENIAASLATGTWGNGEFNPTGELARITKWIKDTEDVVYPLDARFAIEREAAIRLTKAADKMVKSCLELNQNESPENLQQAAQDVAEFDRMLLIFGEMHPDFKLGREILSDIYPIWNETPFNKGTELLERIKKGPEPTISEEPEIIEPEPEPTTPVMPFRRSPVNTVQITADYMADESNRRILKAFSEELDRQLMRLEQTGEDPELLENTRRLSNAVDCFRDGLNEARRIHRSDYTTRSEDLNALIKASDLAQDLEDELASFMEKYPAALAENGRRFAYRWYSDPYLKGPKLLMDIGNRRTAINFIEDLQSDLKNNPYTDVNNALAEILMARRLSGAVRGKTKNLKITRLSEGELASAIKKEMKDPMFQRFLDAIPEKQAIELACRGHGGAYEAAYDKFREYVFQNQNYRVSYDEPKELSPSDLQAAEREEDILEGGEKKSAAKWIEDAQRVIKNSRSTAETDRQIARIFAARQLAEAERGNRQNLDKATLSEEQINVRAEALLKSPFFSRFLSTMKNAPVHVVEPENSQRYRKEDLKDALAGHGGRLEDKMSLYAHSVVDGGSLNHRLYQRYKPVEYRSYLDYFNKMANSRYLAKDRGDVRNDRLRLQNCQRMMTAYKLGSEGTENGFNKKYFDEAYEEVGKDPMFKLMTMNSERASLLNTGDREKIMSTMEKILTDFTPAAQIQGQKLTRRQAKVVQRAVSDLYRELTGGREGTELKKFLAGRSSEYREMVYQAKRFAEKYEVPNAEDAMKVFASVLDYQKGKEEERSTPSGVRSFETSMKLAKAVVQGTAAEEYLREQINYVNQKRGIEGDVESPKRIRFESIPSALNDRKEREAAAEVAPKAKQEAAQNNNQKSVQNNSQNNNVPISGQSSVQNNDLNNVQNNGENSAQNNELQAGS